MSFPLECNEEYTAAMKRAVMQGFNEVMFSIITNMTQLTEDNVDPESLGNYLSSIYG
jgi:hypothetical protein